MLGFCTIKVGDFLLMQLTVVTDGIYPRLEINRYEITPTDQSLFLDDPSELCRESCRVFFPDRQ